MWILSIMLIISGIGGLIAKSYIPAISIIACGLIFNPIISDKLKTLHSVFTRKWFKPVFFLLVIVIFGVTTPKPKELEIPAREIELNASVNADNNTESQSKQPSETAVNLTEAGKSEVAKTKQPSPNVAQNGIMKVHYIDVGQADSMFIELPNGQTMLIDAGNNDDDTKIVEYIKNLKHDTINYVVGTHPHEDHIGGLDTAINTFNIENIYMPKAQNNTKTFEDVLLAIKNKGLKVNTAKAGVNILNVDNLTADIIAPVNDTYEDLNNYSAVVKITYGNNSFLFMGDAETLSENEIIADVKADVLKVGHHGSDSSTTQIFLNKVSPKHAIISVGKDNSYGHPTNAVLSTLNALNVNVYRTDKVGTIIATSDGNKISVNKEVSLYEPNAPPTSITDSDVKTETVETPVAEDTKEITVYVTKTGAKYHSGGCRYLSKSKIPISLNDAKSSYTPCKVCNPPR